MRIICDDENKRFELEGRADGVAASCVDALNAAIGRAGVINISYEDAAWGLKNNRAYFGLAQDKELKKAVMSAFDTILSQVDVGRIYGVAILLNLCGDATLEKTDAALRCAPVINRDIIVVFSADVDESLTENTVYVIAAEKQN